MVDKVNPQAIGAYLNTAKIADKALGSDDAGAGGFSFGNLVRSAVDQVVSTQKKSEAVSSQAVLGKADLTDVVQAVTEAEMTLQTVMAVRDRLIGAYQDIMRMPI
ncbi:MAG: flagellar hook-basal body complex protein FliE [Rhodospirillales bacterium]|nr:flagellar hook-basal body complex protein FliE [Alphaproteobacteria bacterium]MCB9987157.1 flagellar hook-basal body complex protein FliE [Rhodospirillales bacterium]USO08086.1 MAG: flagellar hook-basal body complex protein FliE [Rhodospirillales bacterium]